MYYDKNYSQINNEVYGFTKDNYFPISAKVHHIYYGLFHTRDDNSTIPIIQAEMELSSVKVDDSAFKTTFRTKHILNNKRTRIITDLTRYYSSKDDLLSGINFVMNSHGK